MGIAIIYIFLKLNYAWKLFFVSYQKYIFTQNFNVYIYTHKIYNNSFSSLSCLVFSLSRFSFFILSLAFFILTDCVPLFHSSSWIIINRGVVCLSSSSTSFCNKNLPNLRFAVVADIFVCDESSASDVGNKYSKIKFLSLAR